MKRLSSVSSTRRRLNSGCLALMFGLPNCKFTHNSKVLSRQVVDFTVSLEYAELFCYHPALKHNTSERARNTLFIHTRPSLRDPQPDGGPQIVKVRFAANEAFIDWNSRRKYAPRTRQSLYSD